MRTLIAALTFTALPLFASPDLTVLVDGTPLRELDHRGKTYIEATRGREYSLRITNPMPYRVAVALSVDGLNTIDAKHSDAYNASKWVLEPYESAEITGWQVSDSTARRFFFTGERNSYGAAIGKIENLGIIEAVFFQERRPKITRFDELEQRSQAPSAAGRAPEKSRADDDYAATGMGDRTQHDVSRVNIELEPQPIASVRLRYEFHPQLVKLGVLPRHRDPLERREKAQGFCPEP
jgi:hypothetical protein